MFKFSYGLYVLTARSGEKDNGCIINTAVQLTDSPKTLTIAVNKANFTEQMIRESGEFNLSVLSEFLIRHSFCKRNHIHGAEALSDFTHPTVDLFWFCTREYLLYKVFRLFFDKFYITSLAQH